jgi:hypothetical protein
VSNPWRQSHWTGNHDGIRKGWKGGSQVRLSDHLRNRDCVPSALGKVAKYSAARSAGKAFRRVDGRQHKKESFRTPYGTAGRTNHHTRLRAYVVSVDGVSKEESESHPDQTPSHDSPSGEKFDWSRSPNPETQPNSHPESVPVDSTPSGSVGHSRIFACNPFPTGSGCRTKPA